MNFKISGSAQNEHAIKQSSFQSLILHLTAGRSTAVPMQGPIDSTQILQDWSPSLDYMADN